MTIREELMKAAEVEPKRGETEEAFLIRLQDKVAGVPDAVWASISRPAQNFHNEVVDSLEQSTPMPKFPDEAETAPASTSRRRPVAEVVAAVWVPKVGAEAKVETQRGAVTIGVIVELEGDDLVLNAKGVDGDKADDKEFSISKLKSFGPASGAAAAAKSDEPALPKDPAVGDTIEVITQRGATTVGNLVEMKGDDIVVKDSTGAELEFSISKLKSFKVKVDNSAAAKSTPAAPAPPAAAAKSTGRRAAAPKDEKAPAPPKMSVGTTIAQIMCADLDLTVEQVRAEVKKRGIDCQDVTVNMIFKDTTKVFEFLRENKKLK